MKALRSLTFALLAIAGFTGCFDVNRVVKLKPDGSGTIEETVVVSKAFVAEMEKMSGGLNAVTGGKPVDGIETPRFTLMDEKKLRDAATKLGEGVTFVSAKPVTTVTGEGFTAIYAFPDINKVTLSKDLADAMPEAGGGGISVKPKAEKSEPITFAFTKGKPATLTVNLPPLDLTKAEPKKDEPAQPEAGGEMAMMMMQQMFKDMKMSVSIEVPGTIEQTNAKHVTGSRVTLMEMDFNKVLANPEKFKALSRAQPKSFADAEALLKDVEGIKIETQPKVSVRFQ